MESEYKWEKSYTDAHGYLLPAIKAVFKKYNVSKNAFILDAGCGGGFISGMLYKEGYLNIYGFDLSNTGIDTAKRNFPDISPRFSVHNAYESKLPEEFPKKYDIILSIEVIEHLYYPRLYLDNIHNWLNNKGILILTTPYHGYLKNLAIILTGNFDKHFNLLWDYGHIKFFSKRTISKLLLEKKFEIKEIVGVGRAKYLWKSMIVIAQKM